MSERNKFPFTASQWRELEHQALINKYIISGMPVPPHLLYATKKSYLHSPLSTNLFSLNSQHVGWNCFQMGLGGKIDPEPGRCRRTDGKKWRCSKDAYQDSKYCERHMHRGKSRSRKPVELPSSSSSLTAHANSLITKNNTFSLPTQKPAPQLLYPYTSSSRPLGMGLSLQENNTTLLERAFFSDQPSGTIKSLSGSYMDDSWNFTTLSVGSCSNQNGSNNFPQGSVSNQDNQDQHLYPLGSDINCHDMQSEKPKKIVHKFIDECPFKSRDSHVDLDDKSASNTRLSISIPNSSHDFPS